MSTLTPGRAARSAPAQQRFGTGLIAVLVLQILSTLLAAPSAGADPWVHVPLGSYVPGRLRAPDFIAARARPGEVGFIPGREAASIGPSSIQIGRDGQIYLLDPAKHRVLGWPADQVTGPRIAVRLPDVGALDVVIGSDGTRYVLAVDRGPVRLFAYSPGGVLRWKAPAELSVLGHPLRVGGDGVVYYAAEQWQPLTATDGTALTPAQQVAGRRAGQPVAGDRMLTWTQVSAHELRFTLRSRTGRLERGWRITATTALNGLLAPPWLLGDDLVALVDVPAGRTGTDQVLLRVSPAGTVRALFSLDARAAWGDVTTTATLAPDGGLYTLRSDPGTGVQIGRFALTGRTAAMVPPGTATPTRPTTKPSPTIQPSPTTGPRVTPSPSTSTTPAPGAGQGSGGGGLVQPSAAAAEQAPPPNAPTWLIWSVTGLGVAVIGLAIGLVVLSRHERQGGPPAWPGQPRGGRPRPHHP